jgi:hypothetical protein
MRVSEQVTNVMDVIGFLHVSLGDNIVQRHDQGPYFDDLNFLEIYRKIQKSDTKIT